MVAILRALLRLFAPVWYFVSYCVPKDRTAVVLTTFPDFDDTARSIVEEASRRGKTAHVLTNDKAFEAPPWMRGHNATTSFKYSLTGLWRFHRAHLVFFTHGLYFSWRSHRAQQVVNLWHGMPIKRIGKLLGSNQGDLPSFDYTIAYSEKFRPIIASAFGIEQEKVLISAHPRMDQMNRIVDLEGLKGPHNKFVVVWLPTYRQSVRGQIRVDGRIDKDVLHSDLSQFDKAFREFNAICFVKPHAMAEQSSPKQRIYQNIVFLNERELRRRDISLYSLLGQADLLLTDVSSVYFDFKKLNRTTLLYCPDLEEYKQSRGFVEQLNSLIDDPIESDEGAFLIKLRETLSSLHTRSPIVAPCSGTAITSELFSKLYSS